MNSLYRVFPGSRSLLHSHLSNAGYSYFGTLLDDKVLFGSKCADSPLEYSFRQRRPLRTVIVVGGQIQVLKRGCFCRGLAWVLLLEGFVEKGWIVNKVRICVLLFLYFIFLLYGQQELTRSSWLNCVLRDDEAVNWVSIGHYEAIAAGKWWEGIYAFIHWTKWRFGQVLPMPDWLTDRLWKIVLLCSL